MQKGYNNSGGAVNAQPKKDLNQLAGGNSKWRAIKYNCNYGFSSNKSKTFDWGYFLRAQQNF